MVSMPSDATSIGGVRLVRRCPQSGNVRFRCDAEFTVVIRRSRNRADSEKTEPRSALNLYIQSEQLNNCVSCTSCVPRVGAVFMARELGQIILRGPVSEYEPSLRVLAIAPVWKPQVLAVRRIHMFAYVCR